MSYQKIQAKLQDGDPVTVEYDYGDNLQEAVEKFGEDIVYQCYKASLVIDLQGFMRSLLRRKPEKGGPATEEEIRTLVAEWTPSRTGTRVTRPPMERLEALLGRLSKEELAEVLAKHGVEPS